MEKTNAEIATLAMLLKGINIKAGARKADCRPFIEKLDEHIDAFVKAGSYTHLPSASDYEQRPWHPESPGWSTRPGSRHSQ